MLKKADLVHTKQCLILSDERVLRFCQDTHQHVFRQRMERYDDGKPADKLGNHSKLDEIMSFHEAQQRIFFGLVVFWTMSDVAERAKVTLRGRSATLTVARHVKTQVLQSTNMHT